MKSVCCYETEIGKIVIVEEDGAITEIKPSDGPAGGMATPLTEEAARQLRQYLAGERRDFSLPLSAKGTPFQQKVWQALLDIPYGETRSYKEIAAAVGNIKACRAVGMANHNNPISFIIPCHRVIAADGGLGGYGGGLPLKEKLLSLEKEGKAAAKKR